MKTVIREVRSLADTLADAPRAMQSGRAEREARIGFATPELLWQVLTAKMRVFSVVRQRGRCIPL